MAHVPLRAKRGLCADACARVWLARRDVPRRGLRRRRERVILSVWRRSVNAHREISRRGRDHMRAIHVTVGLAALLSAAPASALDWEGEIALASDYRWRGVSLSDEDPSLQAEATGSFEGGAWVWGNANTVGAEYGGTEIALGVGYTRAFGPVEWTVGAIRYFYPGERDIDYNELDLTAAFALGSVSLSAGFEYAPDGENLDDDDLYTWIGWETPLPHAFTLHGHIGHDDGVMAPVPYAIDYGIGIGRDVGALNIDLSYVEVESEDGAFVLRLAHGFGG
eukprot:Opistho-1_new@97643